MQLVWSDICNLSRIVTTDSELSHFQYKILHNVSYLNKIFLYHAKQTQMYVLSETLRMKQRFLFFANFSKTNILWDNIKNLTSFFFLFSFSFLFFFFYLQLHVHSWQWDAGARCSVCSVLTIKTAIEVILVPLLCTLFWCCWIWAGKYRLQGRSQNWKQVLQNYIKVFQVDDVTLTS